MQTSIFSKVGLACITLLTIAGCGDQMAIAPATLKVTPQHHGKNINDCVIYIKYDVLDKPSSYDDSAKCVVTRGVPIATFKNLRTGNYYIYGKGFDESIGETVTGGVSKALHSNYDYVYNLAVTEGGHD